MLAADLFSHGTRTAARDRPSERARQRGVSGKWVVEQVIRRGAADMPATHIDFKEIMSSL
ncbi:hypothetical protein MAHJHV53_32250 [Mycobacterium avium subsp. hominissuis]